MGSLHFFIKNYLIFYFVIDLKKKSFRIKYDVMLETKGFYLNILISLLDIPPLLTLAFRASSCAFDYPLGLIAFF